MLEVASSETGSRWDKLRHQLGFPIEDRAKGSYDSTPALPAASGDGAAHPPASSENGVVITRGRCICLRTFTPADLDHLSRWADDEHLTRMVGSELLQVYKDVYEKDASFYDAVLVDTSQIVFIIMANDGSPEPVGLVRLFNIHQSEGYAGIETILGSNRRPEWRGFGVQASRLMAYYGVDVLGLRRIEAKAYEYNPLSINTLKRNGFTHEGTLRKASLRDGRYWDILVFGLLRQELEEQRRQDRYLLAPDGQGDLSESS
jgi:ribosomal-protein-alanine N-acetyltransferase